jgi:2-dehydropantoate 2-reductase
LIDVWAEHVQAVNERGLRIEREGEARTVRIRAQTDPRQVGPVGLVIVFVKSTHTTAAAKVAAELAGNGGLVLTLQNGLGNADVLAQAVDPIRVLGGTTSHGATLLAPGHIRHAGMGPTVIGPWAGGGAESAQRVAELFNAAGIETRVDDDVRAAVWDKLLVNVGINAITALTGIRNGQLLDLEATRELARGAVEEALAVARARGIPVRANPVEHVFEVAEATAGNRSSMGQDVDNRRPTEISVINDAVVREGRAVRLETPLNQALTALIRTLEGHYPAKL